MAQDTDYNPAVRKEIREDADTGRAYKKWKHRAQGAAAGLPVGAAAALLGVRKFKKTFSANQSTTDFNMGAFQGLLESSLRLQKRHGKIWKSMTPKKRDAARAEMRAHRKALEEHEQHADRAGYGPVVGMAARQRSTNFAEVPRNLNNFDCDYNKSGDVIAGVEGHPKALVNDISELRKKKLNVGQTGPQSPLLPQPPIIKRETAQHFGRRFFFGDDANGRAHSQAGTFEPAADGLNPGLVRKAYSHTRTTGVPLKKRAFKFAPKI